MPYTSTKSAPESKLQAYQTMLLSNTLRPELFLICDSRSYERGGYRMSAWVMPGAHVLNFTSGHGAACEVVTDTPSMIPQATMIDAFFCVGERDAEHKVPGTRITHMTAAQTETLPEHLYEDTYNELDEMARDEDSVVHRWRDPVGQCLSLIVAQDSAREIHAQGYHMIAAEGLVLRTQSIFELG